MPISPRLTTLGNEIFCNVQTNAFVFRLLHPGPRGCLPSAANFPPLTFGVSRTCRLPLNILAVRSHERAFDPNRTEARAIFERRDGAGRTESHKQGDILANRARAPSRFMRGSYVRRPKLRGSRFTAVQTRASA